MNVKDLKKILEYFKDDQEIIAAYSKEGEVAIEKIMSLTPNGYAIQLNLESFHKQLLKEVKKWLQKYFLYA